MVVKTSFKLYIGVTYRFILIRCRADYHFLTSVQYWGSFCNAIHSGSEVDVNYDVITFTPSQENVIIFRRGNHVMGNE